MMTPRISTRGRDWRTVLTRRWHQTRKAYHGAEPQAKGSPKERSPVPGTVIEVSKVALNVAGKIAPTQRPIRRPGSGQQDRGGIGANLSDPRASRPMPSTQTLSQPAIDK